MSRSRMLLTAALIALVASAIVAGLTWLMTGVIVMAFVAAVHAIGLAIWVFLFGWLLW